MRPEMPGNMEFGEMREKEIFINMPEKTLEPPKAPNVDLNLDKKLPNVMKNDDRFELKENGQNNLGDKIRQELRILPKIDSNNYQEIMAQVIDKLGLKDEEEKNIVEAKVGVRANISRNLERIKMLDKKGQETVFRDFALEDARWMQKVGECIKNIKSDNFILKKEKEKMIENVWRELREIYNDYKAYYKDFNNECKKYGYDFESNEKGIKGQIAAEELFNIANDYLQENNAGEINIVLATPQQDVDEKTDFFIEVKYASGNSIVMPVQVKAPDFNEKTQSYLSDHLVTSVLKSSYSEVEKIEKFRKGALKKHDRGLYITIPQGEALEIKPGKKPGKKIKKVIQLLENDGTAADDTKKRFMMEIGGALSLDILTDGAILDKLKKNKKGGKRNE